MAITLSGSTIIIDSGVSSGTATGGAANTLTGSGFGAWAGRIVWITGGTGAGQSRFIRTATSGVLTVEPNWDTNPASGSTFSIGYTWADIDAAMASVTVSSANFYLVPNNLTLSAGGFIGSINEHVRFTVSVPVLSTAAGSLWQQGRLFASGIGAQGGSIELAFAPFGAFSDMGLAGRVRLYRVGIAALTVTAGSYRINELVTSEGLDFRDSYFNNVYVVARTADRIERCAINTKPFWPKSATSPALNSLSFIENSFIISGDNGAGADSHYFGLTFDGIPQDTTFNKPYWVWNTTTKEGTYFWNTAAPAFASTYAASYWYPGMPSGAGFYTGRTVNVQTRQPDGSALSSVLVGLWDNSGNAAWMESVNTTTGVPVNSITITTNASGNYSNPHPAVTGQSGLVVAERILQAGATQYGPWTVRARKYGYLEAGGTRSYSNNATETLIISVDSSITQTNAATVAAYTTLETSAKLYDRYQYHLSLAANIKTNNSLSRSGNLINAGSLNVTIDATAASVFSLVGNTLTIKASTYTGDMTTTGVITLANGATFVGTRTDANGTIAPPKTVSITGLTAGSRFRIYNNTTATEVVNQIVAGTSYTATYNEGTGYTTGNTLTITATWQSGTSAKLPFSTQSVVGSTGWSALVSQQDDTVYNAIAVDGSTVTEFTADYPNVQVDISDPNGQTSVDRLYAWFVYTTTTESGIRNWFGGIVAEDAANFRVVTATLNLKLDNISATGVEFTGGHRLYRDDNATPLVSSTTGGGSITLFAGKVYTSVVSTASPVITGDISQVPAAVQTGLTSQGYTTARAAKIDNADVATSTRLASASYTAPPTAVANATAVRTELTTELGRIDVATSTRLASASYTAPDNTSVAAIKTVTNKLDTALSLDGTVYQFTSNALENATGLDAVALRAAIGLASANLDTQLADLPTSAEIATGVWGALVADHTVNNSFGAKLLIASNPQRSVQVTGSNHVAADVHEFQPDVLTSNALAASAITEIQSGLAIEATTQAIKAKTDNLPTDPADQSLLSAAIAAIPTYAAPDARVVDTWRRLGLDPANPLVNTATLISAGSSLQIDVAQTCTSVTTTRQP